MMATNVYICWVCKILRCIIRRHVEGTIEKQYIPIIFIIIIYYLLFFEQILMDV